MPEPPAGVPGYSGCPSIGDAGRKPGACEPGPLHHPQDDPNACQSGYPHTLANSFHICLQFLDERRGCLFAKLARGCLQRGNFTSLQDLVDTMQQYLDAHEHG